MKTTVLILAVAAILAGCAGARSTVYKGERVGQARSIAKSDVQTNKPILMTKGSLPPEVKVEVVGEIRAQQSFYGDTSRVYESMAAKARQVGADAVVEVKVKYRVAAFAWGAPSISGVGIKIIDDGGVDIKKLEGEWR
ncbi:hypothetical protein [Acidovorax sp. CCYZU-2555]|uniref:hypothetical protein n=1 Tax=Acidovorax sp. CCYZU-2555 TaxID=2835042 RepID=UPI001BCCFB91|nr:hypothetical protein [Acidovorax sp. CCYZU-2555]MBS7777704.1 hypothetical protein [Acidovorax sp. CCYZU-2555]